MFIACMYHKQNRKEVTDSQSLGHSITADIKPKYLLSLLLFILFCYR
jgi:hypothetical protein